MNSKNHSLNSGQDVLNEGEISEIVMKARDAFNTGVTLNIDFRRKQLQNLKRMFVECESQIRAAQFKDLRKGFYTAEITDTLPVKLEIDTILRNLKKFTTDEKLPLQLATALDKGVIHKEPFGVVLIIGTWNLPIQTTCQPLVGAMAAGNCVILKPSEMSPACANIMAQLLPKYLDQSCYHVVTGGVETSKRLLKNQFDYIFFTGSQTVGKSVMQAASHNLTPLTLELGGINPCYIDPSADVIKATKKILWGKLFVGGQLCIAPGYVMCSEENQAVFISSANKFLREWYGTNAQKSPDIVRIVNKQHFNRLKRLLEATKGNIVIGGQTDEDDLWIEPTIVVNVDPDNDALMQEEIFGPILPIVTVTSVKDAIRIIRSKPKPLSSYAFATSQAVIQQVKESTTSGNMGINDVIWQSFRPGLPFGGIGPSGMGNYHGKYSFDTFSHSRAILEISQDILTENVYELRFPPYTKFKCDFLSWMAINYELLCLPLGSIMRQFLSALIGAVVVLAFTYFYH